MHSRDDLSRPPPLLTSRVWGREGTPQDGFCDQHLEVRCLGPWPTAALVAQGEGQDGRNQACGGSGEGMGSGEGVWSGVQEHLHSWEGPKRPFACSARIPYFPALRPELRMEGTCPRMDPAPPPSQSTREGGCPGAVPRTLVSAFGPPVLTNACSHTGRWHLPWSPASHQTFEEFHQCQPRTICNVE